MTALPVRAHGPSALGSSAHRFVELTLTLARTDFKLRYFGSALGYFWQLVRPLLFFGVIYLFFTQILRVGQGIPHYGVYLLTGIILWTFFSEATGNCVSSLVARESLLRKIRFPRLAVPLAVTLTSVFNLAMNSIAVIAFALLNGISPAVSWLWMLPIVLGFVAIALGLGMLLSALFVRFRDVQPIWEVAAQVLFYASPIMYTAAVYKQFQHIALLNPLALMLTQMGHAFIHPGLVPVRVPATIIATHAATAAKFKVIPAHTVITNPMPSALVASGGPLHVAAALAVIPAIVVVGLWVFVRDAPRFAENL
jgi:ABC-2 type transport system permease protein